jgi:hypothetical protein
MLLELFPLIVSAMAALSFFALTAEESSRVRASAFERRTDKVAVAPDQPTLTHRAKVVE